jgi:CO dehydrogenase/acetyl-CoA synthase beta subunit
MAEVSDELKHKMSEWVELKKQLAAAREDMKVLNKREKELKSFIAGYMKVNQIDKINLRKGKVSYKETIRKPSFTKKVVEQGLTVYFNGDVARVESVMTCILDTMNNETQDTPSPTISLTGIKE